MTRTQLHTATRVLTSCVELAWRGAVIRAARLQPEPMILINPPRPGVVTSYGYLDPPRARPDDPVWCVSQVGGVRVEWLCRHGRPATLPVAPTPITTPGGRHVR